MKIVQTTTSMVHWATKTALNITAHGMLGMYLHAEPTTPTGSKLMNSAVHAACKEMVPVKLWLKVAA